MNTAAQTYRQLDIASMVDSADPHALVQMLFDGALSRLNRARLCCERLDHEGRNDALGSAIAILDGLSGSLDHDKGGELAANLEALYDYMQRRLYRANADNDSAGIDEVADLIRTVSEAWTAIEPLGF